MHVLTKIFIVLVSLLAVFLVPLLVVYAYNEDAFKAKYQHYLAQYNANRAMLDREREAAGFREAEFEKRIAGLGADLAVAVRERDAALVENRQLESRLASAQASQAEIQSELRKLTAIAGANSDLNREQTDELRALRTTYAETERRLVELDEAYRDISSQLEVAVAARRALQEELQRVNEARADSESRLSEYVARFGSLGDGQDAVALGSIPDRDLVTTVVNIRRTAHQTLVEIGAGSRDGVREGWTLTIGRGADFLGKVRIIEVDITRSTGVLMLEDSKRGLVDVGDTVRAWAGID